MLSDSCKNHVTTSRRYSPSFLSSLRPQSLLFSLALLHCISLIQGFVVPKPSHGTSHSSTTTSLNGIKGFRAWFESQFPFPAIVAIPNDGSRQETFDHVLIDMNQILHIVLRKSRSDGHALTLLMKELDAVVLMATPTQSLVLAIDGPPAAAKLATQRKRRYSALVRSEWKLKNFEKFSKRFTRKEQARKLRSYSSEVKTLCITPGTDFMKLTEQALIYWAWQRLQRNSKSPLVNGVNIYISPSTVAGEGEVKLLEWILQKQPRGGSLAILGGDSDLVLEGLIIPPQLTHNVFVLLPDGNKQYLSVSLWETTRALAQFLPHLSSQDLLHVRTDLVLLLILNGNDYFPKLRGCSGFNKVFHPYLRLVKEWHSGDEKSKACLVDPDTLEYNLDFCIAFFQQLASNAPPRNLLKMNTSSEREKEAISALSQLHNFVDSGFLPQPVRWKVIKSINDDDMDQNESLDDEEESDDNDENGEEEEEESFYDDDDVDEEDVYGSTEEDKTSVNGSNSSKEAAKDGVSKLVRMTLGNPKTPDDYYKYEVWHNGTDPVRDAKQRLAIMALDEFLGTDYAEKGDGDTDLNDETGFPGITTSGYEWEIHHSVEGKVDRYLGGLLWNLQTYQDGICADYNFNYGKRLSPTAQEIVDFFSNAKKEGRSVGRRELLGDNDFSPPVSAGLSCLAALPSQVKELVPEPYRRLPNEIVEEYYAQCMDPEDNVFDMKGFEQLCDAEIAKLRKKNGGAINGEEKEKEPPPHEGRRIIVGDHYWTVFGRSKTPVTHPFEPPLPFSDRLSTLRQDNMIRVSRMFATDKPRPRSVWMNGNEKQIKNKRSGSKPKKSPLEALNDEVIHSDFGSVVSDFKSIADVPYKTAYSTVEEKVKVQKKKSKMKLSMKVEVKVVKEEEKAKQPGKKELRKRKDEDATARMKKFKKSSPPEEPVINSDGQPAMVCLKQLEDCGLVGSVEWTATMPSKSAYAVIAPHVHEHNCLKVNRGPDESTSVLSTDLFYEQDREVNTVNRKLLQHHLASFALTEITGPRRCWSNLSFIELRDFLLKNRVQPTSG
jgi:5'-3' exonuclease